jgi:hypothetical protein
MSATLPASLLVRSSATGSSARRVIGQSMKAGVSDHVWSVEEIVGLLG